MRVLVLLTKFSHHGANGGYKQLIKFVKPTVELGVDEDFIQSKKGLRAKYQWLYEFDIRKYLNQFDLIHIMYGEDYFRFSPWLYPKKPIVVTFHQPYESLLREVRKGDYKGRIGAITHLFTKRRFKKISAAIVTEASQKRALSEVMDANKIHLIPLGVHLEAFSSAFESFERNGEKKNARQVITVGNWKRDWSFYCEVVEMCKNLRININFHVVNRNLSEALKTQFRSLGVTVHEGLDDASLKLEVFRSSLMFLPVTEASGNNALLESLALGVPVLMTDVLKEKSILSERAVAFHKRNDAEDAIQKIRAYFELSESERGSISDICRSEATQFDWPVVAARTMELYKQVIES
ncbi:MAG: glycosyltransferase [Flavobacteriales bacterium]|jgi:glycosyltransferase involved in cell wall biosynthesis